MQAAPPLLQLRRLRHQLQQLPQPFLRFLQPLAARYDYDDYYHYYDDYYHYYYSCAPPNRELDAVATAATAATQPSPRADGWGPGGNVKV